MLTSTQRSGSKVWSRYLMHVLLNITVLLIHWASNSNAMRKAPEDLPDVVFSESKCRILLNEINTDTQNGQYIEISKYCQRKQRSPRPLNMNRFKLIFINHLGYLISMCPLNNTIKQRGNEKYWFYTIGDPTLPNTDFSIRDCQLPSIFGRPDPVLPTFPKGIIYPMGVALVYHERPGVLGSLKLTKSGQRWEKVQIDLGMEGLIMRTIVDFYIYGAGTQYSWCSYFHKYYTGFKNLDNPMLREWSGNGAVDLSLSRCGSSDESVLTLPFQVQLWAYTSRTPGAKNSCKNGVRFAVEDDGPQRKRSRSDTVEHDGTHYECLVLNENNANDAGMVAMPDAFETNLERAINTSTNGFSVEEVPRAYRAVDENSNDAIVYYAENTEVEYSNEVVFAREPEYADRMEFQTYIVDDVLPITELDGALPAFSPQTIPVSEFDNKLGMNKPYIWRSCIDFDAGSMRRLTTLTGEPYNPKDVLVPEVCNWFELTDSNKMRCKLCNMLLNQQIIFDRPRSPMLTRIMTTGIGYLVGKDRKNQNRRLIQKHLNNSLHLISTQFFEKIDEGSKSDDAIQYLQTSAGAYLTFYNETRSMIVAVYQAVQLGLPFYRYSTYTSTLKHFGVPLGHLYANPSGMQTIAVSIANSMLKKEILDLKTLNNPVSLIVDEMTDRSTKSVVAFLFQTLSADKEVKIYLYKVIDVKGNITGVNIFNMFKQSLEADNLGDFTVSNLIAMASDGGSNFRSTFREKLQNYTNNQLLSIHCKCHVLERINYHAIKSVPYLKLIDKTTNEVFRTFNSRSSKRKQVLEFMILKHNDTRFEVKKIQEIRWVASKLRALKNIIIHWKTILAALRNISSDRSYDGSFRLQAASIEEHFLDPVFLASLAFSADVSNALTAVSLEFQTRGFTPILMKEKRLYLNQVFEQFNASSQFYLNNLLSRMEFTNTRNQNTSVSLDSLETEFISLDGISLNPARLIPGHTVKSFFETYTNAINEQVNNYFPAGLEDDFSVLDPLDLEAMARSTEFRCDSFERLNRFLKWGHNDTRLCNDWKALVTHLILDKAFQNQSRIQPEQFWTNYLAVERHLGWTAITIDVVTRIIFTPATSVDAERFFSLYSATKTLRRYSLKVSTVEALLRIRFNGVQDIKKIDVDYFLRDFISKHSRVDDKSRWQRWPPGKQNNSVQASDDIYTSESEENSDEQTS